MSTFPLYCSLFWIILYQNIVGLIYAILNENHSTTYRVQTLFTLNWYTDVRLKIFYDLYYLHFIEPGYFVKKTSICINNGQNKKKYYFHVNVYRCWSKSWTVSKHDIVAKKIYSCSIRAITKLWNVMQKEKKIVRGFIYEI